MIVYQPGSLLPPRSLNAMLREAHEENRATTNARLVKRRERGLPAWEGPNAPMAVDVSDTPPYEERPELEGVMVSVRNLRQRDFQKWQSVMSGVEWREDMTADEKAAFFAEQIDTMRGFIREAIGTVTGIEVAGRGPTTMGGAEVSDWTDPHLDILETSDLISELVRVATAANRLSGAARGNFGASQPSTSATSTATPAPSTSEMPTDVSDLESPGDGSPTPSTSGTDVRALSSVSSRTSTPSYSSTATQERVA